VVVVVVAVVVFLAVVIVPTVIFSQTNVNVSDFMFKKSVDLNSCTFRSANSVPYLSRRQLKPYSLSFHKQLQVISSLRSSEK
jgi:hypothetical protein